MRICPSRDCRDQALISYDALTENTIVDENRPVGEQIKERGGSVQGCRAWRARVRLRIGFLKPHDLLPQLYAAVREGPGRAEHPGRPAAVTAAQHRAPRLPQPG